jgi:tetratricopeptide (TPR) repeat protein
MSRKRRLTIILITLLILVSFQVRSQNEEEATDDLGNVSDAFQEHFFEALKQKGIENYDLAIKALKKAERAAKDHPENSAVIHFEMGKNYVKLKDYDLAEDNYNKVLEWDEDRVDVMESLYDLYYLKKDYDAALPLVMKLIPYDEDYKEDLANLYHKTRQYDKAIEMLDELDELWGESNYRDSLRSHIYKAMGNSSKDLENLVDRINSNPKREKEYLNLIYLYSEQGEPKKAFETAKELQQKFPESELVHLALYKFYLDEGDTQKAFQSMRRVFSSEQIDDKSKLKVLEDYLEFIQKHPQYASNLNDIISMFPDEQEPRIFELVGNYYLALGDRENALLFLERGLTGDTDNFSLIKNTLLLQVDLRKYEEASALSLKALEIFPAQPLLYLLHGVSNIKLNKPDIAIESLEDGLDYLFDDPKMERDYYLQLSVAYTMKGDSKKADQYTKMASEIQTPE